MGLLQACRAFLALVLLGRWAQPCLVETLVPPLAPWPAFEASWTILLTCSSLQFSKLWFLCSLHSTSLGVRCALCSYSEGCLLGAPWVGVQYQFMLLAARLSLFPGELAHLLLGVPQLPL